MLSDSEQKKEKTFYDDIQDIFYEAQHKTGGSGEGRCQSCGGVFEKGECIECGRMARYRDRDGHH